MNERFFLYTDLVLYMDSLPKFPSPKPRTSCYKPLNSNPQAATPIWVSHPHRCGRHQREEYRRHRRTCRVHRQLNQRTPPVLLGAPHDVVALAHLPNQGRAVAKRVHRRGAPPQGEERDGGDACAGRDRGRPRRSRRDAWTHSGSITIQPCVRWI